MARTPLQPALWWILPVAVLVLLGLQVWFPDSGTGIQHDSYSSTADGQRAFYRLVESQVGWVDRNNRPLLRALSQGTVEPMLCILGPERWPTTLEWKALLDWVEEGGQLIFAFRGLEEQTIPELGIRYVPRLGSSPPDDSLPPQTRLVDSTRAAWWTDGRLVAPASKTLVTYDRGVQAVMGEWGAGRYVVLASSLVFSNQLLTYGDNPVLAMRLLEQAGPLSGVTFDESLNSTGTPKAVGILFDRELRPLVLQLILLAVLYAWWNVQRFGPCEQPAVGSRRNIVDHADALGLAYWRTRDGSAVLQAYWKHLLRDRLRWQRQGKSTLLPQEGSPATSLSNSTTQDDERGAAARLIESTGKLVQQPHVNRATAAASIRQLSHWRKVKRL